MPRVPDQPTGLSNGVHHLAIATADIARQIEFFNDVLGTELVARCWMRGVEGAWHGFLKLNGASMYFARPADLSLEVAPSEQAIDGRAWIEREAVGLARISQAELERNRNPAP